MKIRTGFVSNSSSSSFVACGVYERILPTNLREEFTEYTNTDLESGGQNYDFIGITLDTFLTKYSDKTLNEFKFIVAEQINKQFGVDVDPKAVCWTQQGWYNG